MNLEDIEIARAELADLEGIASLAEKNAPERGGQLSVHLEPAEVAAVIRDLPIVVARKNAAVIGFVMAQEKSPNAPAIVQAMLQQYPGSPGSYSYGPVCVDESLRGHGVAGMMFAELRRLLPGREGVLFIKASNEASLRAHRKMGMREVGAFVFEGTPLLIFAYQG